MKFKGSNERQEFEMSKVEVKEEMEVKIEKSNAMKSEKKLNNLINCLVPCNCKK